MVEHGQTCLMPRILVCDRPTQLTLNSPDFWDLPGHLRRVRIQSCRYAHYVQDHSIQGPEAGGLLVQLPYRGEYRVELFFDGRTTPIAESLFVIPQKLAGKFPVKVAMAGVGTDAGQLAQAGLDVTFYLPESRQKIAAAPVTLGIPAQLHRLPEGGLLFGLGVNGTPSSSPRSGEGIVPADTPRRTLLPGLQTEDFQPLVDAVQAIRKQEGLVLLQAPGAAANSLRQRRMCVQAIEDGLVHAVDWAHPTGEPQEVDLPSRFMREILQESSLAPMALGIAADTEITELQNWTLVFVDELSTKGVLAAIRQGLTLACQRDGAQIGYTGASELKELAQFLERDYFSCHDQYVRDAALARQPGERDACQQKLVDLRWAFWGSGETPPAMDRAGEHEGARYHRFEDSFFWEQPRVVASDR